MKVNVGDFFAKNASLHLALVAGAVISGGCAPQVFRPNAYIPPPVPEPPQYQQVQRPAPPAPAIPAFNRPKPAITPVIPPPVPPVEENTLPPLPPIESKEIKYTVQKGDSFWKIGRKYGVSMAEIAAYNNLPMKKHLQPGQTIILPPGAEFVPAAKRPVIKQTTKKDDLQSILDGKQTPPLPIARPSDGKYIVMKGDYLSKIAQRFSIKTSTLANANNLAKDAILQIGQVLIIPGMKVKMKEQEDEIKGLLNQPKKPAKQQDPIIPPIPDEPISIDADLDLGLDEPMTEEPLGDGLDLETIDLDNKGSETEDLFNDIQLEGVDGDILVDEPIESIDTILDQADEGFIKDARSESIELSENLTLEEFAQRYGVSVDSIKKLNKSLPKNGKLKKGTKVTIPHL